MDTVYKNETTLFFVAATISSLIWLLLIVGTIGLALIYIFFGFIVYLFVQSAFISHIKGNGVRITAAQFPDLHESLARCCKKIGIERPPEMYLLRTDFFNALATKFLGRDFIVLFTDVVDALDDEPGAVDFYIGHELGHIHRKHLKWTPFLFPALLLPVLGTGYRRAQEYTCDRYGASCCRNEADVRAAIAAISAGDTRWKTLDSAGYLAQIPATSGFWMSFHELTSDYPWLTKRMGSALAFLRNEEIRHPRRNFFAGMLSVLVPRLGGGGAVSLLVVVAVIGILAAVAIPAYQDYTVRAQISMALGESQSIKSAVADYVQKNDAWPAGLTQLGYAVDVIPAADGMYEIGVYEEGVVAIGLGVDAAGEPQYLVQEPYIEESVVHWQCYGQNMKPTLLPSACR